MNITTAVDGSSAHITVQGDIDHTAMPRLRAAVAALPPSVTHLRWDLREVAFMDVAGLHLLCDPTPQDNPRRTTVTGLGLQPLCLLVLFSDLYPGFDLTWLMPDTPQDALPD
jgi:anti-anti-sigma factor